MKVVDMFGCGLPACAVGFNCLSELVRHDENGMVFSFSKELTEHLRTLLRNSTSATGNSKLQSLRGGVAGHGRWQPNWQHNAAPIFTDAADLVHRRHPPAAVPLLLCLGLAILFCLAGLLK